MSDGGRTRHTAVTEYEYEPVPGLPERLPSGEAILWQGAPRWDVLARRAFHVRKVAFYFLLLVAWAIVWDIQGGRDPVVSAFWLVIAAASAIGLLTLLARSMARSTLYTITNHRVVMRFGVAIPMTINLPFAKITAAALRDHGDGTGDIPLTLAARTRTSYLVLWPHVRPWHFSPAEPMLRAVPEARRVAEILAGALKDAAGGVGEPSPAPMGNAEGSQSGTSPVGTVKGRGPDQDQGLVRVPQGADTLPPVAYTSNRA